MNGDPRNAFLVGILETEMTGSIPGHEISGHVATPTGERNYDNCHLRRGSHATLRLHLLVRVTLVTGSEVGTLVMLAFTAVGPRGSDKEMAEVKMMITVHRHICERKRRWRGSEAGSARTIFRASLDQSKKSHGLLTFGHCS